MWLKAWFKELNTSKNSEIYSGALLSRLRGFLPSSGRAAPARTCRPSLLHTLWIRQVSSQLPQTINHIRSLWNFFRPGTPSPPRPYFFFVTARFFLHGEHDTIPDLFRNVIPKNLDYFEAARFVWLFYCLQNVLGCRSSITIIGCSIGLGLY